jgi:glutamine amidotransferase-like uncharacterized protein
MESKRLKPFRVAVAVIAIAFAGGSPPRSVGTASILLFNGTGTSPNDVKAVERVLKDGHLDYATVGSRQLDGMTVAQLKARRLIILPGGNFLDMGHGLASDTLTKIHNAVGGGLNYLGICAGGLLAGHGPYKSLNLTSGVRFDFYAAVNRGVHKTAVSVSTVGAAPLEQYWEDGPQFTGWGEVVGKYPDGTPAIVQGTSGKGWVVLCGVHPEAPESWRHGMTLTTPASDDNAYARRLIEAALNRTSLPHE